MLYQQIRLMYQALLLHYMKRCAGGALHKKQPSYSTLAILVIQ